jgi:hypothetical protein
VESGCASPVQLPRLRVALLTVEQRGDLSQHPRLAVFAVDLAAEASELHEVAGRSTLEHSRQRPDQQGEDPLEQRRARRGRPRRRPEVERIGSGEDALELVGAGNRDPAGLIKKSVVRSAPRHRRRNHQPVAGAGSFSHVCLTTLGRRCNPKRSALC